MSRKEAKTFPIDELRLLVSYDPATGNFVWLKDLANNVKAGTPAFSKRSARGYPVASIQGKNYLAHRVAWALHFGEWPEGDIDHINGNRQDNRVDNLRVVSNAENCKNKRPRKTKKSGLPFGVYAGRGGRFKAQICCSGKNVHLGTFNTPEDAAAAYEKAKIELGYHPNHGKEAAECPTA